MPLFSNMLRSRLWQACKRSAAIHACSAPEAATKWQNPCPAAAHLTQTRNFEIGVVRDKLSNAIREYREIVQKDRLKNYWERKVGPVHYAIHSWALRRQRFFCHAARCCPIA